LSHHPKLTKRQMIRMRNKRNQMIFQHARIHQAEHNRIVEDELMARLSQDDGKTTEQRAEDKEVWSAKTQMVRNRITGKRTKAKERWNRFAGTSGGGARGL
tara:strand:- start:3 stop:305 length:303 start_codon:yes stop_codon:yes gene_type:complete